MSKQNRYSVTMVLRQYVNNKDIKGPKPTYTEKFMATNAKEARDKAKIKYSGCQIVGCVLVESHSASKKPDESGTSLGGMLLGAAVTAGIGFVANKWLNKKDNT